MKTETKKPKAQVLGEDRNFFSLVGICRRALKREGLIAQSEEMSKRVFASKSYEEALQIMGEYCELC